MLVAYAMSITSLFLFCGCCYALIKAVTKKVPFFNNDVYSKAALRIARGYKIVAWSVMTGFFLITLVSSFIQVFTEV